MDKNQNFPTKIYFENLNALRFIAAFCVIVYHIEQFKSLFHISNHGVSWGIRHIGNLGVDLFFVLSGFLISYLLLKEKELTRSIDIKKFYIRRVLRIWPLYFLTIFLGFFIFPFIKFLTMQGFSSNIVWQNLFYKLLLYIVFLPNLVLHIFGFIPYVAQTWTIGAEEQFYILWPVLNKYAKNKWVLMFAVIFIYLLVKFILPFFDHYKYVSIFYQFWKSMPIDNLAIGGLFALIINENSAKIKLLRKILFSKFIQIAVLLLTIFLMVKGYSVPYLHYEFHSLLFGILIINFACNKRRIFSMEYSWLSYLGKISYGLYMFNPVAVFLAIKFLQYINVVNSYFIYSLSFIFVVSIASLSYEFFEKRFILAKERYSIILSGDIAKKLFSLHHRKSPKVQLKDIG